MPKKKIDPRIQQLIETSVALRHRGLMVLVGDHGKDQVVNLHLMLSKMQVKARPSVLWCYKKEVSCHSAHGTMTRRLVTHGPLSVQLGFSTHRKKRMRQVKKAKARGTHDVTTDDPFELFITQTGN